jgi:4-diphosphocytidyl-2-C-methyl-D-erythritol kinase
MIERRAFAKLNLDLRITGVRADGYHELCTVFQTIDLHDVLRVDRTSDDEPFAIACDDASIPEGPENLVWRAAERLADATGVALRGTRVQLWKGIPAQGGLGGGSADAAVALAALNEAWGLRLVPQELTAHAAALGADVPFFLLGGMAQARGRGDDLRAWPDLPRLEVVLVFPSFGVPTADAYRWHDERTEQGSVDGRQGRAGSARAPAGGHVRGIGKGRARSPRRPGPADYDTAPPPDWRAWLSSCQNDLQAPVAARFPVIDELCNRLFAAGALLASMSGSGSTVFGVFDRPALADAAADALQRKGFSIARTHTLARRRYLVEALGDTGTNWGE